MIYLNTFEKIPKSDFIRFDFEKHNADEFIHGDELWSNGASIEIAIYSDDELITHIYDRVFNKDAFLVALRKAGFYYFEPTIC